MLNSKEDVASGLQNQLFSMNEDGNGTQKDLFTSVISEKDKEIAELRAALGE